MQELKSRLSLKLFRINLNYIFKILDQELAKKNCRYFSINIIEAKMSRVRMVQGLVSIYQSTLWKICKAKLTVTIEMMVLL